MTEKLAHKQEILKLLNEIIEVELAGVVKYTHYSLMVYGYNRIPIVSWLRSQATESLTHAQEAGELITHYGEHPSLTIGDLLETHNHNVGDILRESLVHEENSLNLYKKLFKLAKDDSIMLEEYAQRMVSQEELHLGEVDKMLRDPGDIGRFKEKQTN
jgi:bacterioferritin